MHATFPVVAAVEPKTMNEKIFTRAAEAAREPTVECRPAECEPLRHQEMLVRELEHRTLNILQIIASMISIKSRAVHSEETRRDLEDIRQRVLSVATMQRYLHVSGAGKPV